MSERLGPVSYKTADDDPFLGREMQKSRSFSEHTMEVIDEEVHKILDDAAQQAVELLNEKRNELQLITDGLIEHEELDRKQIRELIGPSVHDNDDETSDDVSTKSENGQVGTNGATTEGSTASSTSDELSSEENSSA